MASIAPSERLRRELQEIVAGAGEEEDPIEAIGHEPPATLRAGVEGSTLRYPGAVLADPAKGRLFVADRNNNRIQILDAESYKTLDTWYQFSRLSGIFIDKNDMLYGADSESSPSSNAAVPGTPAWIRGIRIGSAKDAVLPVPVWAIPSTSLP